MKNILVCIGTRPEAIKLAPLINTFKGSTDFKVTVCTTGQHKDMVDPILSFFDIVPDIAFSIDNSSGSVINFLSNLNICLDSYLEEIRPDLVMAQGDTTTVFAAALASYYKKIPFAHVEAGLRTENIYSPWPEEGHRRMISPIAAYNFAPTEWSRQNLLRENIQDKNIYVTGNTVVDALLLAIEKIKENDIKIDKISDDLKTKKMVLITNHRRENFGDNFDNIFSAIAYLVKKYPQIIFVLPMHLNPNVREQVFKHLDASSNSNLYLIEPQDYPEFVYLMKNAFFIITDSGGVQEEAPSLGVPVLVTRDNTERPEGVEAGVVQLIGTKKDDIISSCINLIENSEEYKKMAMATNPYGDGTASENIYNILMEKLI